MTTFAERLDALPELPEWRGEEIRMSFPPALAETLQPAYLGQSYFALSARLRLAIELLEEVANAGVVQSLRQYEELQVHPELRANAGALVEKVRGELR